MKLSRPVISLMLLGVSFGSALAGCSSEAPIDESSSAGAAARAGSATSGSGDASGTGRAGAATGGASGGSPTALSPSGGSPTAGSPSGGSPAAGSASGGSAAAGSFSGGGRSGSGGRVGSGGGGAGSGGGGAGSAGSASGGGSGSGGSSSCGVSPVNPNATRQAKNLLCYLYSQYKNHVLAGQQETSWSNPGADISWYTSNGMKAPAILGGDYLYPDGTTNRAIAYWKAGGITMIRYHMGAPPQADTYESSKGTSNIDNVLKSNTPENDSFNSKLDYVAGELGKLQAQDVPVLWAPFHEVQPGGWFWWAKGSGAQFIALWKYMYDYLTNTKKLNNLVWLMPFSGSPSAAYYPGKQYLDLSGPDTYAENEPFTAMFNSAKGVIGGDVPIPLHETGRIPTPSAMFPSAAPWVLFNIWSGYQSDGTHNTTANIKSVYDDPHTVTRDEVPNLN